MTKFFPRRGLHSRRIVLRLNQSSSSENSLQCIIFSVSLCVESGEPPIILDQLNNQTVISGGQLKVTCHVSGDPQPAARWYLEGTELLNNDKCRIMYDKTSGRCDLIMNNINKNNEGRLSIEVENDFGKAHSTCLLLVKGKCNAVLYVLKSSSFFSELALITIISH